MLAGRPPFEGRCDSKCGWDDGEPCDECQDSLFAAIEHGQLEFPEAITRKCSPEVINLVCVQSLFSHPLIYRFHDASRRIRLTGQPRPRFYATHGSRRMISADSNRLNQTYPLPHFKMRSLRAHNSVVTYKPQQNTNTSRGHHPSWSHKHVLLHVDPFLGNYLHTYLPKYAHVRCSIRTFCPYRSSLLPVWPL